MSIWSHKFTPGPWYMSGEGIYHEQKEKAYESGTGARPVAFVHPINPDAHGNARLIAEAPTLLKALITLRNDCYNKEGEIVAPSGLVLDATDELIKLFSSANP